MTKFPEKPLGCGMGLRSVHYPAIVGHWPKVDWFEAISENYMDSGGRPLKILEEIRAHYPVGLHGVSLSIGSVDPLSERYLTRLKTLVERIQPEIVSDHLCWSGVGGYPLHDLLPLPFTEESVAHIVSRVQKVQDFLGRKILLENVSTYVTFKHSVMPEWEFLREVARRSGCGILLDLNNIYVNSVNHGFDAYEYLRNIPAEKVGQFHLAGHTHKGSYLFDTHSRPVIQAVWDLYREALALYGQVTTLVEWDEDIPAFEDLMEEVNRAKKIYAEFQNRKPQALEIHTSSPRPASKTAPSLAEVEELFRVSMKPGVSSLPIAPLLNPQAGDPGEERIPVYADGYPARMQESLKESYPAVLKALGEGLFWEMSQKYAERFPSEDYNLNNAGRHLPEFLRVWPEAKDLPFLPDLADLEWKIAESFHAFDTAPLVREAFGGIALEDWEKAAFQFQPSVALAVSKWPVLDIWMGREPKGGPQNVLVFRKGLEVRCALIPAAQAGLLQELKSGKTLGEASEKLAETASAEELDLASWFSSWMHEGLIAGCSLLKPA